MPYKCFPAGKFPLRHQKLSQCILSSFSYCLFFFTAHYFPTSCFRTGVRKLLFRLLRSEHNGDTWCDITTVQLKNSFCKRNLRTLYALYLKIPYKAREYCLDKAALNVRRKIIHAPCVLENDWNYSFVLFVCTQCSCLSTARKVKWKKMLASLLLTWGPLLQCCSKQTCTPQRLKISTKCFEILLKQRVPVSHRQTFMFSLVGWNGCQSTLGKKIAQTLPWA